MKLSELSPELKEIIEEKRYMVLNEKRELVPATMMEWGAFFESIADRRVAWTELSRRKHICVSTVFIGMDIGICEKAYFETMIFGTSVDGYTERYADWRSAELGHARAIFIARQARQVRAVSRKDHAKSYRKMRRQWRRSR